MVMPVVNREAEFKPIDASHRDLAHQNGAHYLYRGYLIVGVAMGWDIFDPQDAWTGTPEESDIGFGISMYEAMAVVNEHIEGTIRRKSK